jgi:hypothetical protein
VVDASIERRHQVQALASGQFRPRLQPFILQHPAQGQCRLDHEFPGHAFARIEIEHEQVRMLDVVDARVPRVQLDRADLDKAEQTVEVIDPKPRAFAAFALLDRQRVNGAWDGR